MVLDIQETEIDNHNNRNNHKNNHNFNHKSIHLTQNNIQLNLNGGKAIQGELFNLLNKTQFFLLQRFFTSRRPMTPSELIMHAKHVHPNTVHNFIAKALRMNWIQRYMPNHTGKKNKFYIITLMGQEQHDWQYNL